ncbi:unnamed protein product [Parajaminaea phylloscopi]
MAETTQLGAPWANAVRSSLQPRLLRLPILTFAAIHFIVVALQLPAALKKIDLVKLILLPLRPTLLLSTSVALILGVLPTLALRRRILTRSTVRTNFVSPIRPPVSAIRAGKPGEWISAAAAVCGQPSVWLSALLAGVVSFCFNLAIFASLALYADDAMAWLPYHQVPSVRRGKGSRRGGMGLPSISSFHSRPSAASSDARVAFWRPNEVVWALLVEPFFVGLLSSLLSNIANDWPVSRLAVPDFPFFDTIEAVQAAALGGGGVSGSRSATGSLASRVAATIPRRISKAAIYYFILSQLILLVYLPIRLPLFRVALMLLPPYSSLRRLVIPTLQSQYSIYTASNLVRLFGLSAIVSVAQGIVQALSSSLWEIYATHPLTVASTGSAIQVVPANGLTSAAGSSGASIGSANATEALLQALEAFGPKSKASPGQELQSLDADRFLLTHALVELAAMAQQQTTDVSGEDPSRRRRRDFWKHFAPSSVVASSKTAAFDAGRGTATGTVSAWERVSEVLLMLVRDQTAQLVPGHPEVPQRGTATSRNSAASASSSAITPPSAKAASTAGPLVVSSSRVTPKAPGAQTTSQPSTTAGQNKAPEASGEGSTMTIWQRLVATTPQADSTGGRAVAPPSRPSPASAVPTQNAKTVTAHGMIQGLLPARVTALLQSPPSAVAGRHGALLALLCSYTPLLLLSLSLQEDEWGTVTLSERRDLGLDAWIGATQELLRAADAFVERESTAAPQDPSRQSVCTEWKALSEEVGTRLKSVRADFALGPSPSDGK